MIIPQQKRPAGARNIIIIASGSNVNRIFGQDFPGKAPSTNGIPSNYTIKLRNKSFSSKPWVDKGNRCCEKVIRL
jgi:hypothetical protein